MAEQQVSAAEVEKRLNAGEQLATVLGVSELKLQAIAALGFTLYSQGKFDKAETLFRAVIAADNTCYFGYAGLGAVALAKKPPDLENAYTNLSKAAELNPNDATVQANLGEVLIRQSKLEEAKEHLEKSFELDPGHNDPGANRARAIVGGLNIVLQEVEKRIQAQQQIKRAKAS